MLQHGYQCTKSGEPVVSVLRSKHLDARHSTGASLNSYPGGPLEIVPVDVTEETVIDIVGLLYGGAGPGGADLVSLQNWILHFGAVSGELGLTVGNFTEWMENGRPPWAAYRELMGRRMIDLDKQQGFRPVRVGETYHRLMAK